ncbi:hypothetical protein [Actinomadura darangshiensis]|uniref:hypothetical protein n=1 Tax=Actinomadura darangshiensis TaxID=705336 RepID=UPI0014079EEF|nr:hypothetical protein [Actinomadura darangshiensis]
MDEAIAYAQTADRLFSAASDNDFADCLDCFAWLVFAECSLGMYDEATAVGRDLRSQEVLAYGPNWRPEVGRAELAAELAHAAAGDRPQARERLRAAAEVFESCGMKGLHAQDVREQRRLGIRVPSARTPAAAAKSREDLPFGLSPREHVPGAAAATTRPAGPDRPAGEQDGSPASATPQADDVTPRSRRPWPRPRGIEAAARPTSCAPGRTTATTPMALQPARPRHDPAGKPAGHPPNRGNEAPHAIDLHILEVREE